MESLYKASDRQRVAVTNSGDEPGYLSNRGDLKRHSPDDPFTTGDGEALTEVVYDGAYRIEPGERVEWVVEKGRTLYGAGELDVEDAAPRGRAEGEKVGVDE